VASLVAIDLGAARDFVTTLKAIWARGDTVLPIDPRLAPPARQALLEAMAPSSVVDSHGEHRLDGGRPTEDGDALVMPTSGSSGAPKGVVLTHDSLRRSAAAVNQRLGVDPERHRWLACLPLCHMGGLGVVTRAMLSGTPFVVHDGFRAAEVMAAAGPEVLVSLVPTALSRVSAGSFRTVLLGGAAPLAEPAANVVTTYGMTETVGGAVFDGLALDGVEIRIGGGAGRGSPPEIELRLPWLLRCYRDGTVPVDVDGWYRTGDCGCVEANGRLTVLGRVGDLIISGGENVWPNAVEAVLHEHPQVAEVAVVGRPDPEWGQRVTAIVVPVNRSEPPSLEVLRDWVRDRLAGFAAPRELELVEALPRTAAGKLRRSALG